MRDAELVERTVLRLVQMAVTSLPNDVLGGLEKALDQETEKVARVQLRTILDNVRLAERTNTPICQDTGVPIFFVSGEMDSEVEEGIRNGIAQATRQVPLRPNVVHPLTRENRGDNTGLEMPWLHRGPAKGDWLELTYLPKGAGSENMSRLFMLNPTDGVKGIKEAVLRAVVEAGGRPCPPTIVGVGIGGTADGASWLAKRALLRSLDDHHPDTDVARMEEELASLLNDTGIGPMGLGGRTTVLGVKIELASCHTASLPVAVNLQCWAARKATARIHPDGRVQFRLEGFS